MTVSFPSSIRPAIRASKSRSQPAAFRMSSPRRGIGYSHKIGSSTPVFWEITLRLTKSEARSLQLWFVQDIKRGVDEFLMPIRTEFGLITHVCRFLDEGLLDASEDGQTWVYTAQIMARAQIIPESYIDSTDLIFGLPNWEIWAALLDQTVTQELPT